MKAIKLAALAIALAAGMTSVQAQTADEIMTKHNEAMGGAKAWKDVKTMKMEMGMSQQGMEINMSYTILVDKAMRMDVSVMGMNGYQIVNGNQGWRYMPFMGSDKVDTMKKEEIDAMKEQMDFKSKQVLDYKATGGKAEMDGKDTIDGSMCYKVKVTDKEGNASTHYIDSKTFYTMRTESTVKTDEGEKEATVVYKNYKKLPEGMVMPMSIVAQGAEVTFKTIEINKPVDEKIFTPTKG